VASSSYYLAIWIGLDETLDVLRQLVDIPGSSSSVIGSSEAMIRFEGVFYSQDFPYKLVRNAKPGMVTNVPYKAIMNLEF
jgi:hypothetical protein